MKQSEFDFNVLINQNNQESENILLANEKHLAGQCKTLFEALKRGERLTTADGLLKYHIGDLRSTVRHLRNAGIEVKDRLLNGRFKEYFL